jgi:hypothetical protein
VPRTDLIGNPTEPMTGAHPPSALGTTSHDNEHPAQQAVLAFHLVFFPWPDIFLRG